MSENLALPTPPSSGDGGDEGGWLDNHGHLCRHTWSLRVAHRGERIHGKWNGTRGGKGVM